MNKMKSFFKMLFQEKYLPLWIFAAIHLLYHIFMREPEGSDAMWFFQNQLDAFSLKDFLIYRYGTWSSRFLIEGILVFVSRNILLWKILDYFFWMFLAWAFVWLFPEEKRRVACAMTAGFLLIYPIWDLQTAGWIATSVNYTWVLALGIFSLHGVARVCYGKKTPFWLGVLYLPAALFGANMEQMCAVLLAVNLLALLYFVYRRISWKEYWHVAGCFLVSLAEFLFILTCPGNEVRKNQEIINWMPRYVAFGLPDKICLGFMDTMKHLMDSNNLMFLMFAGILAVLVFLKSSRLEHRFIALVPVVVNVVLVFFRGMLEQYLPEVWKLLEENVYVNEGNYQMGASYIPMLVYLAVIGSLLISLVVVCENWLELTGQCYLLALGLATRVIMGFSPTIYVSGERTFLFLYMILGVSGICLVVRNIALLRSNRKILEAMQIVGLFCVMFSVIFDLVYAGS